MGGETVPERSEAVLVESLVKRYGELVAVDGLSLRIARGEVLGLLGPNGSGKTTTINCLLQLLTYDRGEISVFGERMTATSYDLKRRIGIVPQDVAVFDELTVAQNVDAFCALYVHDRARRRRLVEEAIAFVELERFTGFRPAKLSGGLLRRLNIACGIVHAPELIILDEPTVAVDPQSRNAILEGIRRLNERGATIVYTSHYMEEVEQLCHRIVIMDAGRQVASGTADELKAMIGTGERIRAEIIAPRTPGRAGPGARAHRLLPGPRAGGRVLPGGSQPLRRAGGADPGRGHLRADHLRAPHAQRHLPGDHRAGLRDEAA